MMNELATYIYEIDQRLEKAIPAERQAEIVSALKPLSFLLAVPVIELSLLISKTPLVDWG